MEQHILKRPERNVKVGTQNVPILNTKLEKNIKDKEDDEISNFIFIFYNV